MPTIHIETITPVHIGTGNTMRQGIDYIKKNNLLYVLDLLKVTQALGGGDDLNSIKIGSNRLTLALENNNLENVLARFNLQNLSKRTLSIYAGINTAKECREQIRDPRDIPYIPGSSIKGAIRTALLADYTFNSDKKTDINNIQQMEKNLFGANPEEDIFRFLHVGDAYFAQDDCQVLDTLILNERGNSKPFVKEYGGNENKPTMVEAIAPNTQTDFQLQFTGNAYKRSNCYAQDEDLHSLFLTNDYTTLFEIINIRTEDLLYNEIEWWEQKNDTYADLYISNLKTLLKHTQSPDSCLLRVGYGSGFRFITGDWTRQFDAFDSGDLSVPKKWWDKYQGFEFPKSRRVTDRYTNNQLQLSTLGFVKLTLKQ